MKDIIEDKELTNNLLRSLKDIKEGKYSIVE
jgi:hypothetical protein